MKKFKKIMAILVAAVMIVAMWAPAMVFAAAGDYMIYINNALVGETYSAYKIFDLTDADPGIGDPAQHTYVAASGTYAAATDTNRYYQKKTDDPIAGAIRYEDITDTLSDGADLSSYFILRRKVAYTISDSSPWYTYVISSYKSTASNGLNCTPSANDPHTLVVTFDEEHFDPADFAEKLKTSLAADAKNKLDNSGYTRHYSTTLTDTPSGTANGITTGTASIDVGEAGYYFVDTTLGAFVALDSASKKVNMYEKNTAPSVTKFISDKNSDYTGGPVDVNMGDVVYYQIEVTDGRGTDADIVVHDLLEDGLTLNPTFTVKKKLSGSDTLTPVSATVGETVNWVSKIKTGTKTSATYTAADLDDDSYTFEIVLKKAFVDTLSLGDKVYIEYSAKLNATDGEIYYPKEGYRSTNGNTVYLTYFAQNTEPVTVSAKTYEFKVYKYDESTGEAKTKLPGVSFSLRRLTKDDGGVVTNTEYYKPAADSGTDTAKVTSSVWAGTSSDVQTTDTDGYATFRGLDSGEYVLVETATAPGFNLLTKEITVNVATDGTVTASTSAGSLGVSTDATNDEVAIEIPNTPGKALPSTGGMGTTVLYIVGGMLVILAGAYLFFSRKRTA